MSDKLEKLENGKKPNPNKKKNIVRLLLTAALSLVLLLFYRVMLLSQYFPIVMWSYMIILTVLIVVYIVYNRGFSRKGVTEDMLPEDWDIERKQSFVQSGKDRMERSKWMLMLIIAFLVTLLADAIELFVVPMVSNWF